MRKIILFLFGAWGIPTLHAQSNFESIFTPKTQWEVFSVDANANGSAKTQFTLKDTTMNGHQYMVFIEDKTALNSSKIYLREDQAEKKIYAFENGKEFLLYDFNLNIGDKFYLKQWEFEVIGTEIVQTQVGNRKCLELKPVSKTWDNIKWIEGIGSTISPLYYKKYGNLTESSQVTCLFRDGKLVYSVNDWNCAAPTATKDIAQLADNIKTFPNPFQERLNIKIANPTSADITIRLSNISGQTIFQKEYRQPGEILESSIDVENINNGILFLTVQTSEGQVTKRLVKE